MVPERLRWELSGSVGPGLPEARNRQSRPHCELQNGFDWHKRFHQWAGLARNSLSFFQATFHLNAHGSRNEVDLGKHWERRRSQGIWISPRAEDGGGGVGSLHQKSVLVEQFLHHHRHLLAHNWVRRNWLSRLLRQTNRPGQLHWRDPEIQCTSLGRGEVFPVCAGSRSQMVSFACQEKRGARGEAPLH